MELSEETQECPYCGLCYTDFEFHIRIHDDCKMLEEQRKALGRKREDMLGLEDALRLVDSHLQPSVDEEEDGGGDGQHGEPGNFESGSGSGFIVPKIEPGIRKTGLLEECGVFLANSEDGSEAVGFPVKIWNNLQSIKTELKDPLSLSSEKQEDEELEKGNLEVKQKEQMAESEPNKVTLTVKTSSEPGTGSPAAKSRTFKMVMKPGCSLAKVKESMSKTLNVPVQRIVLKKNRTTGNIDDSCLVQEFHGSVIFAFLL